MASKSSRKLTVAPISAAVIASVSISICGTWKTPGWVLTMSRSIARLTRMSSKRYFTGLPCKNGHIAERNTRDRSCVECCKARASRDYHKNKKARHAMMRDWCRRNPERMRFLNDRANRRFPTGTPPEPTRPRPAVCENCKKPEQGKRLALDHDHETGVFRGWLCSNCNSGLGKLGDSIAALNRMIRYLRRAS